MRNSIFALSFLVLFGACKTDKSTPMDEQPVTEVYEPITPEDMETAVIYEANIRQYSPEGTFAAFTKDIPQLKELGVKVIWLMPIFPISETKRKAEGSKFASDFPEEERQKYLGSYYAVTDFSKINPEFGTIQDFRTLVKTAHENNIYVILDWVPNHTGWDHEWITSHPEYYTTNEQGEIIHPENTDWTDVADLNYNNTDMRKEMIKDMIHWVVNEDIDGFRCDVAGSVPLDFWEQAIPELRAEKSLFMLAEAWEPELLKGELFDMAYAWDGHHLMNGLAQGTKTLDDYEAYLSKMADRYEPDDILMNFVTNHDENSWNGTIEERLGDAAELMTALSYMLKGMPLIYSGQEYNLNHRLKFFEKDSIPKVKASAWTLLKQLGHLKTSNPALNGGKNPASYKRLNSDAPVLMFERAKQGQSVLFVGNFSSEPSEVVLPEGKYKDYLSTQKIESNGSPLKLDPWGFKILIQ